MASILPIPLLAEEKTNNVDDKPQDKEVAPEHYALPQAILVRSVAVPYRDVWGTDEGWSE